MTSALTLHTTSYPSRAAQILCEATDMEGRLLLNGVQR